MYPVRCIRVPHVEGHCYKWIFYSLLYTLKTNIEDTMKLLTQIKRQMMWVFIRLRNVTD
jgi:hypothetical protein